MNVTSINSSPITTEENTPLQHSENPPSADNTPIQGVSTATAASGPAINTGVISNEKKVSLEGIYDSFNALMGKTGMTESRAEHAELYKLMFQLAESLRQSAKDQAWMNAIAEKTKKLAAIEEKKDAAQTQLGVSLTTASLQMAVAVVSVKASADKTAQIAKQRADLGARPEGPVAPQQEAKLKAAQHKWDMQDRRISEDFSSFNQKLTGFKGMSDSVTQMIKSVGDYLVELERYDAEQMQVQADMMRQMSEEMKSMAVSADKLIDAVLRIIQSESQLHNQAVTAMFNKI